MRGALDGLRVVDFGQYVAGPLLGTLLADAGASVTHIDPPGGPRWVSPANAVLLRGRAMREIDLKSAPGREEARQLAAEADVLIEGFRPGVMARLGLSADDVLRANPAIVYCSLPGFGADDPRAGVPGWEGVVAAAASIYRGVRDGPAGPIIQEQPSFFAIPFLSAYAAMIASHSVVAALLAGGGVHVEVPLYDAGFEITGAELQNARIFKTGALRMPPWSALGYYQCRDGGWIRLCLFEDRHIHWFARRFLPELAATGAADPDRLRAEPELERAFVDRLEALFAERDAADWEFAINDQTGAPGTAVQSTGQWLRLDPQGIGSKAVVALEDPELGPTRQLGQPVVLGKTPLAPRPRGTPADGDGPARPSACGEGLPLDGVRVVDFTQVLAGPTAARVLAEYGAEVFKINNTSDRSIAWHTWINAGKQSMLLDLKADASKPVIRELLATADVLSQNFARGVADRLGIGEGDLRAVRPDAVYSSISCFGYEGPRGSWRGREELGQAVTGLQDRWRDDNGKPAMLPFPLTDIGSGHLAAFGILLALYHRRRTGEGQSVSASLAHTGTLLQAPFMLAAEGLTWDIPTGQRATGWGALHRLYRARDRWFFVAAGSLDGVEGLEDLQVDEAVLEARFATLDAGEWVHRFTAAGHGAHQVVDPEELSDDPIARARKLVVDAQDGGPTAAVLPRMPHRFLRRTAPAGAAGADASAIIERLGLADHWGELTSTGAVVDVASG